MSEFGGMEGGHESRWKDILDFFQRISLSLKPKIMKEKEEMLDKESVKSVYKLDKLEKHFGVN